MIKVYWSPGQKDTFLSPGFALNLLLGLAAEESDYYYLIFSTIVGYLTERPTRSLNLEASGWGILYCGPYGI